MEILASEILLKWSRTVRRRQKKQQNLLGKKQSPVSRIEIVVLFFQLTLDIVALE
jgi:hypothetical protein